MLIYSKHIPFIVVQFPPYADAEFASRWLGSAADADRLLSHHCSTNPDLARALEYVGLTNAVEFSWAAMEFIYCWQNNWPAFSFNLFESEWFESFAYMAGTGFFTRTGQHHQMAQPTALTTETIAQALLKLAATEDEEHHLNPQWLLATMTEERRASESVDN